MAGRRLTGGQKKSPPEREAGWRHLCAGRRGDYDIADFSARLILPFAFKFVVAFGASVARGWAGLPFDWEARPPVSISLAARIQ